MENTGAYMIYWGTGTLLAVSALVGFGVWYLHQQREKLVRHVEQEFEKFQNPLERLEKSTKELHVVAEHLKTVPVETLRRRIEHLWWQNVPRLDGNDIIYNGIPGGYIIR